MPDSLLKIKKDLILFKELEISQSCIQPVMGKGSPKAKIMFIGEAPGAKEDQFGIPFVGRSGKLLDQLIQEANIKQSDIYITNIVKFRPPKNRDPNKNEIVACKNFLEREIALIKPKIIAPLGKHAMEFFLPSSKENQISLIHGTKIEISTESKKKQIIFPLYHPAVALYNPNKKALLQEDFKKLSKLLHE